MLCSLSFTDLFRSVIVALAFLFIRLRHLLNSQVCQVYSEIETMPWASCALITYIGTILNVTIISVDRYLAVRSVCQYRFWVTRRRALFACTVVWVVSIAVAIGKQVAGQDSYLKNILLPAISIPSGVTVIILQIKTVRLLRRHNKTVADIMDEGHQTQHAASTVNAATERRLSKITTYVVGGLALIFIPVIVIFLLMLVTKTKLFKLFGPLLTPLFMLWSSVNPVLYYRGNEKVKQGIFRLLKCQ